MTTRAGKRPRPRRDGRSPADVITGVAAVVVLLALAAGVPLALIALFGSPIPHTAPSLSLLTRRLTVTAVLKVCSAVLWLAWLQLVWCLIAEVSAAWRNSGMPARVPLAGATQAVVHRLVTTALLLSAAAAVSPTVAYQASPPPRAAAAAIGPGTGLAAFELALPPVSAGAVDGNGHAPVPSGGLAWEGPGGRAAAQAPGAGLVGPRTEKIYVVEPPEGRFHESLWEIAEAHLGDGRRYREIFELNAGRPQPDGSRLTIASLIRPGWVLVMPHDAHGPGIQEITVGHHPPTHAGPAGPAPRHQRPSPPPHRHQLTPGRPTTAPPRPRPSARPAGEAAGPPVPGTPVPTRPGAPGASGSPPAPSGTSGPAGRAHSAPAPAAAPGSRPTYPIELAGAGLLAAAVLYALERRRRRQRGRRPAGRRVAVPRPDVAWAEAALLLGEDGAAAELLDAGLRQLGEALAGEGRGAPAVFAAHVGEENVDLWVAPAGLAAPAPWHAVGDGQVWRLPLTAAAELDHARLRQAVAPYPGLVTIGTDVTGRVLVDVASARGLIAVGGPAGLVAETLTAVATELATSRWSEGIHLTLVGFGEDLAVLAPDRVQTAPTLAEALPDLEAWAAEVADAAALGAGPGRAVGAEGLRADAWEPRYLITAVPPSTGWERERLLALARTGQAAGAGYVAAGDVPGAAWSWEISADGRLRAGQLGLDVQAQRMPAEQEAALVELFETAGDLAGAPMSAPLAEAPAEHLVPGAQAPVEVTLLGPVQVAAPGYIEPDRLAIATELVVYLAAHPGGVHPNVLTAAIWPRGVTPEVPDALVERVREWLGTDGLGRPHLASDAGGRLRLGSGVRVDWHVFGTLVTLAGQAEDAPGRPPGRPFGAHAGGPGRAVGGSRGTAGGSREGEGELLARALGLVKGPFLDGRPRGRYAWLATDGLEYDVEARVADAAHRLCELRLAAGDPGGAMEAVRAGLLLAEWDELLWQDLIVAAHAAGSEEELREVVGEVFQQATADGGPGLAPQTEALIDELLPSWRWSVA